MYMSKVIIRNDISHKMTRRAISRRNRRSRKTRYRKERFLNRKNSMKSGKLSPTMISKLHSHVKEIEYIKSILPITTIVLETATFDCHLMKNPLLANKNIKHWGYQKGANYGFENTKAMVLDRDKYKCQVCKGRRKSKRLEVHHIVFRSRGGSDEAENLITLCSTCHKDLHNGNIKPNFVGKTKDQLRHATQMNIIRCQLLKIYPNAIETFGYITKANRLLFNDIIKDHHLDACIIATGGKKPIIKSKIIYIKRHVAKGDYRQNKGTKYRYHIPTGKLFGFRKYDKVKYFGKEYFIQGKMSSGRADLMDIYGKRADFSYLPRGFKVPKMKNLKRLSARNTVLMITSVA